MESERFDRLARAAAGGMPRRRLLGAIGSAAAAQVLGLGAGRPDAEAQEATPTPAPRPRPELEPLFVSRELVLAAAEELRDVGTLSQEARCGPNDESQQVEQYDGSLGVTRELVARRQPAVGQLQWNTNLAAIFTNPGDVSGVRWCSGTLIDNDLLLTAGHCFSQSPNGWTVPRINGTGNAIPRADIAANMHVNFNFQVDPAGVLRTEQQFPIVGLVEDQLGDLDFAIVRLGGNPGRTYGRTPIGAADAGVGSTICIIGHPDGRPKAIEAGPASEYKTSRIYYDDIDTLGGNSGSGILASPDGVIVGVHTDGGCDQPAVGNNHGHRISALLDASPTLSGLVERPLGGVYADEGRVTFLRVHDVGTGYGPPVDAIDAEAIVTLDRAPGMAFGFTLRDDANQIAHRSMLDTLRAAFNQDRAVRIEFVRTSLRKGRALRVMLVE